MPPVEMQQHVSAYVRVGGLPRPAHVFANGRGVLQLLFPTGCVSCVTAWATELGMPRPEMSAWGYYVSCSEPGSWYGWTVIVRCDMPSAPQVEILIYANRVEVHVMSPDPDAPQGAGPLLGVGYFRPGRGDYLVTLPHQRPFVLQRHDDVVQAIAIGRAPAAGRPA